MQLVKKFPAFHGTRRFITALTSVRHLSLSWASPIQSTCPHPTSWRYILILSTHLRLGLPSGLFPSGFPTFYPSGKSLLFSSTGAVRTTNITRPTYYTLDAAQSFVEKPQPSHLVTLLRHFCLDPLVVVTQFHPLFMAMRFSACSPTLAEDTHNHCRSQETVLRTRFIK